NKWAPCSAIPAQWAKMTKAKTSTSSKTTRSKQNFRTPGVQLLKPASFLEPFCPTLLMGSFSQNLISHAAGISYLINFLVSVIVVHSRPSRHAISNFADVASRVHHCLLQYRTCLRNGSLTIWTC